MTDKGNEVIMTNLSWNHENQARNGRIWV